MASDIHDNDPSARSSSRFVVVVLIGVALLTAAYLAFGMPGMDHGGTMQVDHEQKDMP